MKATLKSWMAVALRKDYGGCKIKRLSSDKSSFYPCEYARGWLNNVSTCMHKKICTAKKLSKRIVRACTLTVAFVSAVRWRHSMRDARARCRKQYSRPTDWQIPSHLSHINFNYVHRECYIQINMIFDKAFQSFFGDFIWDQWLLFNVVTL